ncbi:paraquat-inducible membrane protein A [Thalassotalea sp. M1531]|uniref:Paraquat-inducible membrane protein A n=1 Tax=Thalassotalea algicola TaxID=2716224 RepID=A0A7Y0LBH7_9GAMM|nr:paraquat-inducible protein A [Thalassotalea algicola]NMP30646.1 paraquat-inducible membrane protein A [Thalassotalea algicola]
MNKTAKSEGLSLCPKCYKANAFVTGRHKCQRCNATFYQRKPRSIEYTIAWTIAALVMFIPANLMPIMVFTALGNVDASTILGGIQTFLKLGMYPVAIVVFIASFIVPLGKILGLVILVLGVRKGPGLKSEQRTKLYHVVEFLGPWSMLDVFVVALMAAVVNLGFLTSIEAGPGITYFTLMVVFTMFAAESFDPRLLWDSEKYE